MIPVIASRPDGLGTRLLTFLYARSFAEILGTSLAVLWPSLDDVHYGDTSLLLQADAYRDVFATDNIFRDGSKDMGQIAAPDLLKGKRLFRISNFLHLIPAINIEEFRLKCRDYDAIFYDVPFVAAFADRVNDPNEVKRNWSRLSLNEDVLDRYESFRNNNCPGEYVAVHVRRGDLEHLLVYSDLEELRARGLISIFQRYIPLRTAIAAARTHLGDLRALIVCSEDAASVTALQTAFPETCVTGSGGLFPVHSTQAALLDLLLLANSHVLISPFQSYFSECAASVGSCGYNKTPLDIESLVPELIGLIDRAAPLDAPSRRAIVYWAGYENLWWSDEKRNALLAKMDPRELALIKRSVASKVIVETKGVNVALNKTASQSSLSEWSEPMEADNAVNGSRTGRYAFHTKLEDRPWWKVDLGQDFIIHEILIFNRLDAGRERARLFTVSIGCVENDLREIYRHDGEQFGGDDGYPARVPVHEQAARFIRISLESFDYLHLDQVEVYSI